MTNFLKSVAVLAIVAGLSACGGGGGGGSSSTVVTPPVSEGTGTETETGGSTGGTGTETGTGGSTVDNGTGTGTTTSGSLVAGATAAQISAAAQSIQASGSTATKSGYTRTTSGNNYVDLLAGTNTGRVLSHNSDGTVISGLVGATPTAAPVSGVYTGTMDATWKSSSTGTVQTASNNVSVEVDVATGEAVISSYLTGQTENALIANNATISGSKITSDAPFVSILNSTGNSIGYVDSGSIEGTIDGSAGVVGVVNAVNQTSGAEFVGGFTAATKQ